MPKDKGFSFPKALPRNRFESEYVQLTEDNKAELLVVGRVIWVIRANITAYEIAGCFNVRPRFVKNKTLVIKGDPMHRGNMYQAVMFTGETPEEYSSHYNSILKYGMEKGELYVNPKEKLVEFKWI